MFPIGIRHLPTWCLHLLFSNYPTSYRRVTYCRRRRKRKLQVPRSFKQEHFLVRPNTVTVKDLAMSVTDRKAVATINRLVVYIYYRLGFSARLNVHTTFEQDLTHIYLSNDTTSTYKQNVCAICCHSSSVCRLVSKLSIYDT